MLIRTLALAGLFFTSATPASERALEYTLRFDPADLSGVTVELHATSAPASLILAAQAHPEYDDKYWRYVADLRATNSRNESLSVQHPDSVRWRIENTAGDIRIRYRVNFPREALPRASWKPFLTPTGGLIGGPHSFLYPIGFEHVPVSVTLDIPREWKVGTGLEGNSDSRTFTAPNAHALMESPMLVGNLSEWSFVAKNVPHRVFYWRLPDATTFDSVQFVRELSLVAGKAMDLFGAAPYVDYTFLFQDGAYTGGLEHPNSVTLGAPSAELGGDRGEILSSTAHEFVHAWNLMAIKPMRYREMDYRPQPPVAELWFSEGLTMFYADLLLRRAGLPTYDSTRIAHVAGLLVNYLASPGNARFSAEHVSRVEYNAPPDALGDYIASPHLVGELIGTMLDFRIRGATRGARSFDDVMHLMFARSSSTKFTSADVKQAVDQVCGCSSAAMFSGTIYNAGAIDFNKYFSELGLELEVGMAPARDEKGQPKRDLRIWALSDEMPLRLRISNPKSIWGQAGLHTNDELVSINGVRYENWSDLRRFLGAFAMGDTANIVVRRSTGAFATRVIMRGFDRPTVEILNVAKATALQRALRDAWMAGH